MKNPLAIPHSTDPCYENRQEIAHELENEVNETLASVLLWMRHAKGNNFSEDSSLLQAEDNLKAAIVYVRQLRHTLRTHATG